MTKAQLEKAFEDGLILMKATYHSGRLDKISIRGKVEGGPRRDAYVARQVVSGENDFVIVSRFLNDNARTEDWRPSAKKGDKIVVAIKSMAMENGTVILNGDIQTLS